MHRLLPRFGIGLVVAHPAVGVAVAAVVAAAVGTREEQQEE